MTRVNYCKCTTKIVPHFLIDPLYKNKGIEERLINLLLDKLKVNLKKGFEIRVDIRVEDTCLYQNISFSIINEENRGKAMRICLTDDISYTDKLFKKSEFIE